MTSIIIRKEKNRSANCNLKVKTVKDEKRRATPEVVARRNEIRRCGLHQCGAGAAV